MANIFVGFHDQRSCNRILKPPGGGTSDIFGTDDLKKSQISVIEHVIEKEEKESSTNGNVTETDSNEQEATKVEELKVEDMKITEENATNVEDSKITEENVIVVSKEEEKKIVKSSKGKADTIGSILQQNDMEVVGEQKKKVTSPNRVPPGGYSSGLW